ncbi:cytosolic endo-beta-N-acetylglucosaminidase 1-like [Phalaenopsis equestris]|uniref:cytosolic endo-beta-N-acetylglucosaminidase 1-like n=1 Tax=Phalaenopsis equestris TaxID=78828 RepID=UPI0009E270C1|nr:cytosolic endo-beta-N-acetylglucosaminidase 1-like [Phalaenopsis equestris]
MAPPSDPTKPSIPISYPITDLETLISRSYFDSFHYPFNVSSVPLPAASVVTTLRRRILVCHDFKGGYNDDKWVQGGSNAGAYAFWHWYLMDVFVYFSHYLVTLPPPGWINAAHTHGVKVLGTFLTEWEKGREICKTFLSTTESAITYAERLVELADRLGFDGWLLNIEVPLHPRQIPILKQFIDHLTQTMHRVVPGSLVIWYDCVTIDGKLAYQNQLNKKNKPFFDICDGIFCNYRWKKNYPKDSGAVAGDRRFDVYMGIDVWGRGTYGGGKWNTKVGLDALKKDDVSAAIFGPGWVYETQQGPDFQTAQNRWWYIVEKSWEVLQSYPNMLPFYSNFNQGHGYQYSIGGFRVANSPWNNMACQGFQAILDCKESSQSSVQVFINLEDGSYIGGGSITCKGRLGINDFFSTRLFLGKLVLEQPISLTYHVKSDANSLMGLVLSFSPNPNGIKKVLLLPESMLPTCQLTTKYDRIILTKKGTHQDLSSASDWIQYDSDIMMDGHTMTEIGLLCYLKKPAEANTTLTNKATDRSPYVASLGLIRLQISGQSIEFPSADSWIIQGENISWSSNDEGIRAVSLKITWKLKAGSSQAFAAYNIFVQKVSSDMNIQDCNMDGSAEFLAATKAGIYYVSALEVPSGVTNLNFFIQICAIDGTFQDLRKSPTYPLEVEGR